jgi:hypothetical protein
MTLQILSGGELVYEPWPWAGDWHMFSGNVDDFRYPDSLSLDPLMIWRSQRNVRTVVRFLARSFAGVRLLAYRKVDALDRQRLDDSHPLAVTLSRPASPVGAVSGGENDRTGPTEYDAWFDLQVDLCLYERWAAVKENQEDFSIRLRRLPPRRWRFLRDSTDQPCGIRWFVPDDPNRPYLDVDLSRFVWLDGYPTSHAHALSPMTYLADLLVEETESSRARTAMWRNGARLSGVIKRPADATNWGQKGRDKFSAAWRGAYRRGGTSEGGTPILEDGMDYVPIKTITPEQAQQIEARQLAMAEVATAFGVAPELVGAREGTLSNVQAYRELLYTETLGPMFEQTSQAFDRRLVEDFAEPELYVEHNVAAKLALSFEEQAKVFQTATGAPVMTRSEARARLNLSHLPEADALVVPMNVLTGDQASPTDSRPDVTGAVTPRAVVPAAASAGAVASNGNTGGAP